MSSIATIVCALFIGGLFVLYRDPRSRPSLALWIPTVWILLAASRMATEWFVNTADLVQTSSQMSEGSPLDRTILAALIMGGVVVLMCRLRRVAKVLSMNWPLLFFFGYCALSTVWSASPDLAIKRWFKALGDVVMVLIILTDRDRIEAIKRMISRVAFILMPLSVLLIEFFPTIGRGYSLEDGDFTNTGVTTNKNMLGVVCLVLGLGCFWLFVKAMREKRRRTRNLLAMGTIMAVILLLFVMANSVTSLFCFMMGVTLIVLVNLPGGQRPRNIHVIVGAMLAFAALIFIFPEIFASIIHAFGRNATLTGRTELWHSLIAMDTHPLFGTGFESFWLGNRLDLLWSIYLWQPNEAHNGYLEVYLNLGWVGVGFLALLLGTGYRHLVAIYQRDRMAASLRLAYFAAALAYSFAEAGFRMLDPMWIFLLLAVVAVPGAPAGRDLELPLDPEQEFVPVEIVPEYAVSYARTI
jgi:O-antigen ligase